MTWTVNHSSNNKGKNDGVMAFIKHLLLFRTCILFLFILLYLEIGSLMCIGSSKIHY